MKTKLLAVFLVALILLTGCQTPPAEETAPSQKEEVSSETSSVEEKVKSENYEKIDGDPSTQTRLWESFEMTINDTKIKLNETRLQELLNIGYSLEDTYNSPTDVKPKDHAEFLINPGIENPDLDSYQDYIQVNVANEKDTTETVEDCLVTGLAHRADVNEYKEVVLPGNIAINSTEEEIIAAYGEPNTTLVYENGFKDLSYICKDNKVLLRLELADGKLTFISMAYTLNPYAE